jgi:hypothetical protein
MQATMLKVIRAFEDKREPYSRMLTNGSYYLGYIVAGSGMNRTRVNKDRLRVAVDWALIQINQNRIHGQTQGEVPGTVHEAVQGGCGANTQVRSISHVE